MSSFKKINTLATTPQTSVWHQWCHFSFQNTPGVAKRANINLCVSKTCGVLAKKGALSWETLLAQFSSTYSGLGPKQKLTQEGDFQENAVQTIHRTFGPGHTFSVCKPFIAYSVMKSRKRNLRIKGHGYDIPSWLCRGWLLCVMVIEFLISIPAAQQLLRAVGRCIDLCEAHVTCKKISSFDCNMDSIIPTQII